jgi:hypothetical protein
MVDLFYQELSVGELVVQKKISPEFTQEYQNFGIGSNKFSNFDPKTPQLTSKKYFIVSIQQRYIKSRQQKSKKV